LVSGTKLPEITNVISSNSLELTDRSINNSKFNIDRDFGLFVDYSKSHPENFSYSQGAISKGKVETGLRQKMTV
jgi:hypothetical protein